MSKKTGGFFKSIISKGKGLFKKEDKNQNEANNDSDGTEEDHDIIEVGKQGNQVPATSLLSNLSDFAGKKL